MLQHFTWQQFLVAAFVLSLIWYGVIILVFYRKQFKELLDGKRKPEKQPEPLGHAWDGEFEENDREDGEDLMGKAALPEGMSRVSMSMFGFAPDAGEEHPIDLRRETEEGFENEKTEDGRQTQQSIVPDVLEELKSIFHILETEQGTKQDFISLFGLVSAKYPAVKGTANQQALNDYIRQNVLFPISDEELDALWP